jgi:Nucleotidyl transferase AbiEii toxin, Type IV TA system
VASPGRYPCRVDRDEILRVLRAFEASGLEYVLIGATAMGFHGVVRATEDLDLLIRATAENVDRLRTALKASYADDPHIDEISAADLLGEYPAVRYYPPSGDLYFDILTRLGEAASFETVDAEIKELEGTRVNVATPAALYRLKKGTVRAKDHQDAAALRERFNLNDDQD